MYLSIGKNASNPISENVFAIRQKTPIGATFMIDIVISIMMSFHWLKKLATVDVLLPSFARSTPVNNANTIIGSISPFESELKILTGIILRSVSTIETFSASGTGEVSTLETSIPIPGLIIDATPRARHMASAVVTR